MSFTLRLLEAVRARRLVQDALGCVSREEPRSCQLNRWQPREILWPGRRDRIPRIHRFNPNRGSMAAVRSEVGSLLPETRSGLRPIRYAIYEPPTSASAMTAGVQAPGG